MLYLFRYYVQKNLWRVYTGWEESLPPLFPQRVSTEVIMRACVCFEDFRLIFLSRRTVVRYLPRGCVRIVYFFVHHVLFRTCSMKW